MDEEAIIIVSGLPRSGTSMMMKMLEAGGMEILTDNIRTADEDNPKGYYEFERVKELEKDHSWLENAKGKVVKIISALLEHLPKNYAYKIIFMHRKIEEILASQKQMLIRRRKPSDEISDEKMTAIFLKHLKEVEDWLDQQPNMEVIYINYNEVLKNPIKNIEKIINFLGKNLDMNKMVSAIDQSLYRWRK